MRNFSLKKTLALTPFAGRLLLVLIVAGLAMVVLHLVTQQPEAPRFWWRFFDLSEEYGLGTVFAAGQLVAAGVLAFVNGLYATSAKVWGRVYWWLLAGVLIFLGADEYFVIHESLAGAIGNKEQAIVYAIGGAALTGTILAAYWFGLRNETGSIAMLLVGLGMAAFGGILIDYVQCRPALDAAFTFLNERIGEVIPGRLDSCRGTYPYEEFFETAGISVLLAGFAAHAEEKLSGRAWQRTKLALAAASILTGVFYVGSLWAAPTVEARLLAEPVEVEYLDGALSLIGYRVSPPTLTPGEPATLRLYWRANRRLPTYYYLSAHLTTHPDVVSVAQNDLRLGGWTGWRTDTWLPGLVMRDVVHFDLPPDAPTPNSYWLTLRLFEWYGPEYRIDFLETQGLPPDAPDHPLLEPDVLILTSLPALSEAPLPPPPYEADYHFADGFSLSGYALPAQATLGDTLPLAFWWQTQTDVQEDLTQFIHLTQVEGTAFTGFDQPPFGGSFPTADWPAHSLVMDEVLVPLPEDLPPGEYRVHTGMYLPLTGERRPVSLPDGQPVSDFSVFLGTVLLER